MFFPHFGFIFTIPFRGLRQLHSESVPGRFFIRRTVYFEFLILKACLKVFFTVNEMDVGRVFEKDCWASNDSGFEMMSDLKSLHVFKRL